MLKKLRFPIRFKILIALLLVITAVVSTITFTMANLFHADKSAYIHDLTSEMAMHTAAETRAMIMGYRERLQVFTRIMFEKDLAPAQKSKLLKQLFEEFQEFVAITLYVNGEELANVYDVKSLQAAGLTKENLLAYQQEHQPPSDLSIAGNPIITNSTMAASLPTLTIMIPLQLQDDQAQTAVVAAVIRLEGLQRLATRSKVFTTFIVDYEGTPLAHTDPEKVIERTPIDWIPDIESLKKQQSHSTTLEHTQDGVPMVGGLAPIESSDLLAGVEIPKAAAYLAARELLNNLIVVALALLIMSVIVSLFGARLITQPLVRLSAATQVVAKGQYDIQLESASRDEIDDLAQSFNTMASELDSREKALKGAQAALVQSEKMAAFGQLGAGIAHEIKNPLAGILGLTQLSLRKLEKESAISKNLSIIEKETNRCTTIIQNLLKFARQEKVAFEPVEINRVVADAMAIVEHQLEMNRVKLTKNLAQKIPLISGNANQIQQVLINLMINAQQAMEGRSGEVSVATSYHNSGHVQIQVRDTGPGIPEDLQTKIFEPFFTTKEVGKGTGLGLSVSYGIIQEHGGDIQVKSALGKGTAFNISLPLNSLSTACPKCKQTYKIKPESLGRTDKCKRCGNVFKLEAQ
jgi:two-component system NtrC family sensor kinase